MLHATSSPVCPRFHAHSLISMRRTNQIFLNQFVSAIFRHVESRDVAWLDAKHADYRVSSKMSTYRIMWAVLIWSVTEDDADCKIWSLQEGRCAMRYERVSDCHASRPLCIAWVAPRVLIGEISLSPEQSPQLAQSSLKYLAGRYTRPFCRASVGKFGKRAVFRGFRFAFLSSLKACLSARRFRRDLYIFVFICASCECRLYTAKLLY